MGLSDGLAELSRDGVVAEGRVCRVQLRKAGPAEDGTGRIVAVEEQRTVVVREDRA